MSFQPIGNAVDLVKLAKRSNFLTALGGKSKEHHGDNPVTALVNVHAQRENNEFLANEHQKDREHELVLHREAQDHGLKSKLYEGAIAIHTANEAARNSRLASAQGHRQTTKTNAQANEQALAVGDQANKQARKMSKLTHKNRMESRQDIQDKAKPGTRIDMGDESFTKFSPTKPPPNNKNSANGGKP